VSETGDAAYRARYLKLRSVLFDRTTGLPAFPVLFDELRAMLDQRRCLGILHLEIEHLDLIDGLYGWQVLDRIMSRVGGEARAVVERDLPAGTLLALDAVAGERLVVFVPQRPDGREVEGRWLADAAGRLRAAVGEALSVGEFEGLGPELEVRVGHALLSHDPFYRFERLVYAAIARARSIDRRRRTRRERGWQEELERIIREMAIRTVFQPVVDLRSGALLGYEAFARGPEGSPLAMPREMFAVSQRIGASADLDRTCRRAALRASAFAARRGKLFLNVLPDSLVPATLGRGGGLLEGTLLRPQDVVLEFSEREADEDAEGFAALLDALRGLGFGVALDDVGTGYASQAVLERVRPDFLKLDVSLVRGLDADLIKQEVLVSIVRAAERVGAAVIAEGVEREEEIRALVAAGARYGQGFAFAAPAPAERIVDGRAWPPHRDDGSVP